MKNIKVIRIFVVLAAFSLLLPVCLGGPSPKPPKEPAKLSLKISPDSVKAGGEVTATLTIKPKPGIKLNQYPKISLKVAAVDGLVGDAVVKLGNDAPPADGDLTKNYFKSIDPLVLTLALDPAASSGKHTLEGKLKYYYCVTESGFCAPFRTTLEIPVTVK
jgi:hypothetical protein